MSDILFYNIFSCYKHRFKQNANAIAVVYITFLHVSMLLLFGVFFRGFFRQMNMTTMSLSNAWTLFILVAIFIYFKNWMQYTGKKRIIIHAKMNKGKPKSTYNIYLLWLLPVAILSFAFVVSKAG